MTWRYFATTLNGDGTESLLATDLPLTDVSLTKTLSGVDAFEASLPVEIAHLRDDEGNPVFREWSTAFYAEKDGVIRGAGILQTMDVEDGKVALKAEGFVSYIHGMPYEGESVYIQTDPLVIARHFWEHAQAFDGGNIPVVLDQTTSPVRIGTEEENVEFETDDGEQVNFRAGPVLYNWWSTQDMGSEFDSLAEETPFDYREIHTWSAGERIQHRIEIGYPSLGAERDDLRFVVGENVVQPLRVMFDGADYASEVVVLGAGEGRRMVRQSVRVNELKRLRRVAVLEARNVQSDIKAATIARSELVYRYGDANIASLVVRDHPNAPLGSFAPGDFILVQSKGSGWGDDTYMWVRILEYTVDPESDDITLAVTRKERLAL